MPELLEVSMIASVAGEIRDGALTAKRPFRSPHHSASMAALTGGGIRAKPGEISLAHQGVLFLDELPEFDPRVLDSLRQPLENGEVAVSRANHRVTYPARFMLVAAMNPCRCGHAYEPGYSCKRGRIDRCTSDYQSRISGPLMDRIDLRIEVPAVAATDLILPPPTEASVEVAARVAAARDLQMARYAAAGLPHIRTNAEAPASVLEAIAQPDAQGLKLLRDAAETMRLSARGYHRVLRVARTLADLDGTEKIGRLHLAEALSYRALAEDLRRAARTGRFGRAALPRQLAGNEFCLHSANHKPGVSRAFVERAYHVAFQDFDVGCSIDRCRGVRARRAVAGPAALHHHRRGLGPDRGPALASPASCQFHQRSVSRNRAGPNLGQRGRGRFRRGR